MADVYVNSWADFLTAIAVSGDTVNCPEDAIWDMNEIEPLGHMTDITINCSQINGNGLRIKNLHIFGKFNVSNCTLYDLFLTDVIASGSVATCLFSGNVFFRRCAVSCILSSTYLNLTTRTTNYSKDLAQNSSFYVEGTSNQFSLHSGPGSGQQMIYCRIEIHASNTTSEVITGYFQSCEIVVYAANAAYITSTYFKGCTLRGNLENAAEGYWIGDWTGDISVYSTDGFNPEYTPRYPQYFVGVTEEQLKTPEYLRALGFPIVVG